MNGPKIVRVFIYPYVFFFETPFILLVKANKRLEHFNFALEFRAIDFAPAIIRTIVCVVIVKSPQNNLGVDTANSFKQIMSEANLHTSLMQK